MWKSAFGIGFLALALAGCDADCDNPSRIDGEYAMWSNITSSESEVSGDNTDDFPLEEVFINGWSEWDLKYIPSQGAVQLDINGQPFDATYQQEIENCNQFSMSISGDYTTEVNSIHSFEWNGDMRYMGTHLSGTWNYSDSWSNNSDGTSGSLSVPAGELTANLKDDGDTGFE
jgi:hypothetical protein